MCFHLELLFILKLYIYFLLHIEFQLWKIDNMMPLKLYRGDPIPGTLIAKVDEYIPEDLVKFLYAFEVSFMAIHITPYLNLKYLFILFKIL